MTRAWFFRCNPSHWDIDTWLKSGKPLEGWSVTKRRRRDMAPGDSFALWVTGRDAGVYALGTITSKAEWYDEYSELWLRPPDEGQYFVDVSETNTFFDAPIWKAELQAHPVLKDLPVLARYWAGGPLEMTAEQWQALKNLVGGRGRVGARKRRPSVRAHLAGTRPAGHVRDDIEVMTPAQRQQRSYHEDRLVHDYADFLGRPLDMLSFTVDGGRIECDAYDRQANLLIEAKGDASRNSVRTAIGQLFDYRRFIKPKPDLAVLLPEVPPDDVLKLLRGLSIRVIVRDGGNFTIA